MSGTATTLQRILVTPFRRQASEKGFKTLDGIPMVVDRAVGAFWILHGSELHDSGVSKEDAETFRETFKEFGITRFAIGKPSVSTRMWRLRPFTRLWPSNPRTPPRSVVFTEWPSMITTDGHSERPACARACS